MHSGPSHANTPGVGRARRYRLDMQVAASRPVYFPRAFSTIMFNIPAGSRGPQEIPRGVIWASLAHSPRASRTPTEVSRQGQDGVPGGKMGFGVARKAEDPNAAQVKSLPPLARKMVTSLPHGTPGHSFALGRQEFSVLSSAQDQAVP